MAKSIESTFKRIYQLYTSNLSLSEIERLIKRDAPGVYDFYLRETEEIDQQKNPVTRAFRLIGNLFEAFLRKLSPSRRVLYSVILFLFVFAVLMANWFWAIISFALLNILLAFELADKLTAKDELEVARDIQMNLMPRKPPAHPQFDIACFSEAAREVGGDYFDFINPKHSPETTYAIIGDVSGKGMGAALHMVQVQAILQNLIEQHRSPRDILLALNRHIQPIFQPKSFFTISIASLNADRTLHFCRAGHVPLLHFQKSSGKCRSITPGGIGVGLQNNGKFDKLLEQIDIKVAAKDVLCFYTDGVVEAMNSDKVEFGEERLENLLCENADLPAQEIQNAILSALAQFRGATPPHDDLTLVIMKAI